jgi:hypothetical protein
LRSSLRLFAHRCSAQAWKVLDGVVECALPAHSQHWTNEAKTNRALRLDVPVWAPFVKADQEWRVALRLYGKTEQLRDRMAHRRAEVTRDGELRVADEDPNSTAVHTLTPDEQLAFCRAAQRLLGAVLATKTISPRTGTTSRSS